MTPFEYILPLVSVLVGLAVADLAISLHRMLRARRRVRWDALPLATAVLAVLAVLELWWNFYAQQDGGFYTTLGGFLLFATQLLILFLLNAAALPDIVPDDGLDLRVFYDTNGPYFWSLYAAYVLFIMVTSVIGALGGDLGDVLRRIAGNSPLLILFAALARFRNRIFHTLAVTAVLALFLFEWSKLSLG